jgi:hypothetical protein
MASSTITLYKGPEVATTYTLQGVVGNKSSYINSTSSLRLPDALVVNHDIKGAGARGSDRHQVLKQFAVESDAGAVDINSINVTLSVPRNTGLTDTAVVNEVAATLSYFVGDLSSTQFTKLTAVVAGLIDGVTP